MKGICILLYNFGIQFFLNTARNGKKDSSDKL